MRRTGAWTAAFVAVLGLNEAQASEYLGPDGRLTDPNHHALLVDQGDKQLVIEGWNSTSVTPRLVWLKPLPPDATITPRSFDWNILKRSSELEAPYNQQIRDDLFGPSVVTLLSDRLGPPTEPPVEEPEIEPIAMILQDSNVFSGVVTSSTITGKLSLPPPMEAWLQRQGIKADQRTRLELSAHLNRGWKIAASLWLDPKPGRLGVRSVGPLAFEFASEDPMLPVGYRAAGPKLVGNYAVWVLGPSAFVPLTYDTVWREQPWLDKPAASGAFTAVFADRLRNEGLRGQLELELGQSIADDTVMVAGTLSRFQEAWVDVAFHAPESAIKIPNGVVRGGLLDLLLCLLLGLTPLLYTPESWFLLWLNARAKERRRRGEPTGFGLKLWSIFAIGVGIYWLITLTGPARLAALVPTTIGLVQLILPYTEREVPRVRAQFRKKKTNS